MSDAHKIPFPLLCCDCGQPLTDTDYHVRIKVDSAGDHTIGWHPGCREVWPWDER